VGAHNPTQAHPWTDLNQRSRSKPLSLCWNVGTDPSDPLLTPVTPYCLRCCLAPTSPRRCVRHYD